MVSDGRLICAIEEERIRRVKHWAGLPTLSVKWCLEYSGTDLGDVDYIAVSRDPSAHLHKKILRVLRKSPGLGFLKKRLQNAVRIKDIGSGLAEALGVDRSELETKVRNIEHHRAHLASAFFVSPYREAACLSVDGFGDFLSVMRGVGRENRIDVKDWVEYPHSLGILYTALTQFLGFRNYGDEYKVMGLSAYGEPRYLDEMRNIVILKDNGLFELDTSYFLHDTEGVDMLWEDGVPCVGRIFSERLCELLGKPREDGEEISALHRNVASSLQAIYEETFFRMINDIHEKTGAEALTLSGGCAQNSLANGKIPHNTPYRDIYIPPASYDAGTAVGAAYWLWNMELGNARGFNMDSPYIGPEYGDAEIATALEQTGVTHVKYDGVSLIEKVAEDIARGKVVGWFQGRTEWGPRALGNRSILVDPRRKDMQDILNKRIKRREWFRPFAPSILEDYLGQWFENDTPVPFMEKVYKIRPEKRGLIPAASHVDGTGRLQTVTASSNPRYYALIRKFHELTDVPVLLNTSFNENEPIVNSPSQAIECFKRTKMDVLVIGNYYVNSRTDY